MKKKPFGPKHEIEAAEPRLLFSAGLEGVLAAQDHEQQQEHHTAPIEQQIDGQTPAGESQAAIDLNSELNTELIFVDSDTPEYQTLIEDLQRVPDGTTRYEVVMLDNTTDGISQITETLGHYTNLSAVHILSHGSDGSIDLGGSQLDAEALADSAELVRTWSNAFSENGDLLIYGCNLAASEEGTSLVNTLSWLTGTDVAASDDMTGSALFGADWELEYRTGQIESSIAISAETQQSWMNVMTVNVDNTSSGTNVNTSSLTVSHTTSGTDRLVLVGVVTEPNGGESVSSMTYGGVAMTNVGSYLHSANNLRVELWATVGEPATGTHDVVINLSAQSKSIAASVTSFTGVDQGSPLGTFVTTEGDGTTASVNVASGSGDMVFGLAGVRKGVDATPAGGANEIFDASIANIEGAGSTNDGAPSVTTSWALDVSDKWVASGISINSAALPASSNTGSAIWAESGSNFPEYSAWDGTSFGSEGTAYPVGQWKIMQGAESPQRDEKIVIGVDSSGNIEGMLWDGSSWSQISVGGSSIFGTVSQTYWWGMDVQYESQSGDAVMVWNDGSNIEYATWDGTNWSSVGTISGFGGATPRQLQLAASPNSDEMVLVVSDSNSRDSVFVWNGTGWGAEQVLSTGGDDRTDIFVTYEQQSDHAMVVYGKANIDAYYRTWDGSSWSAEGSVAQAVGTSGNVRWTTMASDPNSDQIALGVLTSGGDVWFNVWDGSSWGTSTAATTTSTGTTELAMAVAFESTSGDLIATYGESGSSTVKYMTWSSGGGWSAEQNGPNIGGVSNSMTLSSDPMSDRVMLAVNDDNSDVNYVLWNGSTWGTVNEQEINSGETKNQPFLFLWDQQPANEAPSMVSWFNDAWESRKALTINAASVAGDLTNFPVLITLNTDAELAAQALANGDDILFTGADGVTQLAHEIEHFDETTGELRVWVKTDLSASVDTDIFMYFGNAASGNQENIAGVWDNYVGVYHLGESPTGAPGELVDSSGSGNHATTEGSMDGADSVATTIGQGLAFDGTDDMIRITDSATLDSINDEATFSLWINFVDSADGDTQIIMSSSNRYSGWDGYEWAQQNDGDHFFYPDAMLPDTNYNLGADPFTNGAWHHLAATMDFATKEVKVYVDGSPMTFTYEGVPGSWTTLTSSDDMLWGGNPDRATRYFLGMMDEIRIADVARSQEWIQTEYNNQSAPGAFFSVGTTEAKRDSLTDINEDDFNSAGDSVLSIISSSGADRIMDDDTGAVEGIAVTAVDDTNGEWQYDANADGTWVAFGAVSGTNAVLLDTGALVRFVPDADYNGSAGDLSFHAWDQTTGTNGNTGVDVSTNGGSTAYSSETFAASLNINPVNDAPAGIPLITGTPSEDQVLTADTTGISDADGLGVFSYQWLRDGVAIAGAIGNTYTLGDADVGSQISVQVSYTDLEGTSEGPLTSAQTAAVANVNDAPLLDTVGTPALTQINEGDINNAGDSVAAIIASAGGDPITDVDTSAVEGIAITWADDSNGSWEYSTDGGSNWIAIGTVSDSAALLLTDDANNRIRFIPAENYNGTAQFSYRAWDQTDGNANATGSVDVSSNGGSTAYSTATEMASVGIQPLQVVMYLSTSGDVSVSGAPGMDSWDSGEVLAFGDPNTSFGSGTTDGTLYSFLDLRNFQTGAVEPAIDGIHQVSKNVTIGGNGGPSMDLFAGDVLFAINSNSVQLTGSDAVEITTNKKSLFMFRPDTPGDYSAGTFSVVLDNFSTNEVEGISLVEVDTMVGDTLLQAGTFIFNPGNSRDIFHYTADGVGAGTTSGVTSTLIAGDDINMTSNSAKVSGLDLIEDSVNVGGTSLTAGNILVTLDGNDAGVGNNNLAVSSNDVFYLDVTTTTMGVTNTTAADAYFLIDGSDINLDTADEEITALSLEITFGSGNEDPDISFPGSSIDYTENDPAVLIDTGATVNDPDSFDFAGGILSVDFEVGGTADDRLAIRNEGSGAGQVGVVANTVTYSNVTIGTFNGGTGTNPLVIHFNSNATPAIVQAVMRNITYENVSDDPATSSRTVRVVLSDGDGGTSNVERKTINMTVVNDAPAIAANTGVTVAEGSTGTAITTAMLNEGDPDDSGIDVTYTVTTIPANGTLYLSGVALGTSGTFTQADIDAGLITYDHDGTQNLSDSFVFSMADGGEDGAAALTGQVFSFTVTNVNDAPTGLPVVTGTATEDQVLTADTSGIADEDGLGAFSYQWYRDGVAIGGATASTYTLGDADVGTSITVVASYTDAYGANESITSAGVGPVANVNDAPVGLPNITGTVAEDQLLTADTSGISDADGLGAFSYQWLRDGVAIGGATGSTYTLGDADVGSLISVQVSYTDVHGTSEGPLTSAQTGAVANVNDAPTGSVTISGTPTEDEVLTASNSLADADGMGAVSYQWYRDGVAIGGATASTYTLDDADVSTTITVTASYTDGQGTNESVTSAGMGPIANINDAPAGLPTITGTVTEDQLLTADTSGISDADGLGAFSYQWLRDGVAIGGATGSTYTLGDADVGALISVQVSYTDLQGTNESVTSVQTAAVANVNDAPTGSVNISGLLTEDQILTASNTLADADGMGAVSYQWYRDGVAIGGATGPTYTLGDADVGATITVTGSYTDGQGTSESVSSAGVGPIANVNDLPVGVPTITGTVTEDQLLTADTTGISDADGLGAFSYQWYRDGIAIGGATGSTYSLGDADVNAQISVQVSYTDGQGTAESITSAQTGAVANVNDLPVGLPAISGTATEDQVLTADTSGISDADGLGAFNYQWYRDGVAIGGATAGTYTLGDADVGTQISVQVGYTDLQGTAEGPLASAQTGAIANINDAPTGSVTIDNMSPTEGDTLTAGNTLADADGLSGAIGYQWYRDGVAIGGATSGTYTTVQADVGTIITVVASYTDDQGTNESVSSGGTAAVLNLNNAPTGNVTISGTPTEDQVLTAGNTLADADGMGAVSYQWYRDGVAIGGATGTTYTLGDADVSATITVAASYTDGQGTNESVTSAGVGPIANVNDAPVGVPTITGTVSEDQMLTADTSGISDADGLGAFSYQWLRDGVVIGGATASTYTLGDTDVGALISVQVSYTDLQGTNESVTSAQTAAVANINDAPTGSVTISGTPTEDQTLTASNTLADADGMGVVSYQWYRDGVAIGGATASTYNLGDADVGAAITVTASYTDGQGTAESVTSAGVGPIANVNDAPVGVPTITGTVTEDQLLTADTTGISDADGLGVFSYQWYRDGVAIGGATASTYTLGDADVNALISVQVSYTDGQGTAESITSAQTGAVANVNDLPVGLPTISGTATEDQVLTADTSGISDADGLGVFSYQWYRDGVAIGGATGSTYTLGDADVGTQISVQVGYTDLQGTAEGPLASVQTGFIANINDAPTGNVTIDNMTPAEGDTLTAGNTLADADGLSGAIGYQWYRDGVAIGGATGTTYTTVQPDVGAVITVVASYTDDQGTSESVSSAGTAAVTNINNAPTGSVTISGTPTEDQVLTASNTLADADGMGAVSYQWYRDGVAISGATGATYTLGDTDVSATITVEASYTDGYGTNEAVTSAGVGPIANINDAPVGLPAITGTVTEDQMLTADTSGITDADGLGALSYQWLRNGVAIGGATGSTYTLGDADVGAQISVQVSYTDLNGTNESVTSAQTAAVANVNDAPTGSVTISGILTEDQILTASNSLNDADGMGPVSYQWYRDGVAIGGATGSSYILGDADVGTTITVAASYIDGHGTNESVSSAGVGPIANVNDAPTGTVTISGTPTEDQVLTASNTLADADGMGAVSYQWYRDGIAIGGAISTTYTLGDADVGANITVEASYVDGHGTNESVASAGVGPIANVNDAPTGAVTIDNMTPAEGDMLTVSNSLVDADGLSGAIGYQWYRDGVAIGGATGSTYTTVQTDVGTVVTVVASYTDDQGTNESVSSAGTAAVTNVNNAPTGSVTISGTPTEDQVLTASNTLADADGMGAVSYQWYRDGVAIGGATASTYTLGDADVGTTVTVTASYTDGGGTNESVTSAGVGPIANINDAPVGLPAITGTVTEDQMLTADTSGITDADGLGAFSYQWLRDGVSIGGATGSTYTLGDADVGAQISVQVSYTDLNGTNESVTSAQTTAVANINDAPTGSVTISGTPTEDQVLTASNTLADADGLGAISYQWYRDGVAIGGATGTTYTLGDLDVGATITVTASYTDGQGTNESVTSAGVGPIANVNDAPVGAPTITGSVTEDQLLTADTTGISDADGLGAFSYQWYRDGVVIGGATASTYTLGDNDVGALISVQVSYTDGQGTAETITSAQTGAVANVNDLPVGLPSITGLSQEDQILTADTSGISDADGLGAFGYQWYRDGVAIGGATGSTYTLGDADVGSQISVQVSYTDLLGTAEGPLASAQTGFIANINDAPTGAVAISGTPTEDQILTASNTLADADGMGAVSYQWYRDGVAIGGATGTTYTLGDADVGTNITVTASYTDGQGTNESVTSTAVGPIANVNDAPVGVPTITGTVTEDQILTADSSGISDADGLGAFSYQWFRDGVAIGGATGTTYTLGDADVGTQISVQVSYTDLNGTNESVTSVQTAAVANINDAPTGNVTIDNMNPAEGDMLTASNSLVDADGLSGAIGYQWYRDGVAIGGATGTTYTTVQPDVGAVITVVASYTDDQGTNESVSSAGTAAVTNINNAPTGSVTISGTPTEDQVLTASNTLADADGMGAVSYQWYRDGVAIGGATGTTYTLGDADVGTNITVTASYTDGYGTSESVTSAGVGPIANINDAPTITNGFVVGLPGTDEDSASAGTTASAILSSAGWNDLDAGAAQGLAITGMTGNGTWQYSTDAVTWVSFGAVSPTNALLLNATTQIRYVGDGQNGEVATFSFRAWDLTAGTASTNATPGYADPGAGGGGSAYSSESASASVTVTDVNDAPTGSVIISGTPTEDQVLTASNTLADVDGMGAISYQWYRDGLAVGGATGSTYTLGDADVGATITVAASYTDGQGTNESATSAGAGPIANINDAPTGNVTIDNMTPAEGDTLTAANTLADADGLSGAISYQWYRDGLAIGGATGTSYTTVQADVGAVITVVASYTDDQGTAESVTSAGTAAVTNVNNAPTGSVTISGTPTEDQVLTASNTLADVDGLGAISYQWYRDGVAIGGATGSTYTLGDADVGTTITVEASYTDGYGTSESVTSAGAGPVANINDAPTGSVTISGTPTEDQTLTASNTLADADGLGAIAYQWYRDGVAIGGATASTYTLGDVDVGATITVEASYTDGYGTSESVTSAGVGPIGNINDAPVGVPTITGTATEDQLLTADTSGISDADGLGAFSYQWYRDGVAIGGATGATYTLDDADVGANITVAASYTDGYGTSESVTSAGVGPVVNINDAPTGSVTISGTPAEDQVLTASNTLADADGMGAIAYQWYRDGVAIGGATGSTYTLGDADVGATITVEASYTDGYGTNESVTSAGAGPIANVNDAPTGNVTISGTPTEDQVLTANNTLADADGLGAISYQWYRDGVAIGGATGSTYTLGDADVGASITVEASYTDGYGTSESVTSAGVGPVANVNDAMVGTPAITGTVAEDQVLTADTSGITDADGLGAFSYQWYRDGSAISGATGSTYTTGDADVGAQISVQTSYTDQHGTAESATSAPTAAVVNINDAPTGSVLIDDMSPDQGDTLTASNTLADADGLSGPISYQWYRDGSVIAGATGATYTTVAADIGAALTVVASYTDDQGTAESISSSPTSTINATTSTDDTGIVPGADPADINDDPAPVKQIDVDDSGTGAAAALAAHHNTGLTEDNTKIQYTVDDYEFSNFDYREDDSKRFGLTAPFKNMMYKAVDVAVDLTQLIDLIRIQINEPGEKHDGMFVRVIGGITLSLSAGMATLLTRSSAIAAGLMSSVSVMKGFDPLVMMKNSKRDKAGSRDQDSEMDEAVDNLFENAGETKQMDDRA